MNHSMGFLANIANAVGGLAGRGTNSLLKAISPQNVQNVQNFVKQIQGQQLGAPQYKGTVGKMENLQIVQWIVLDWILFDQTKICIDSSLIKLLIPGIAGSVAGGITKLATWVDGWVSFISWTKNLLFKQIWKKCVS